MLAGDTHGEFRNVKHKIDAAKAVGDIQRIVVLGDFGLWWGHDAIKYIDEINDYAKANNVQIFAIPGNHENYKWWNSVIEGAPATSKGWAYLRTHVLLSPRVHDFVWGKKQFLVAGGAVSIDKDYRLQYYRDTGKQIWSKDEQLTDAEVDSILATRFAAGSPVDYLLTHDCSNMTPWKDRLKPDFDSQIHRQRIDKVLRAVKPNNHFHGHMHERYEWENRVDGDKYTSTFGLECNTDPDSWGLLDLETDEFTFASDLLTRDELLNVFRHGSLTKPKPKELPPAPVYEIDDDF